MISDEHKLTLIAKIEEATRDRNSAQARLTAMSELMTKARLDCENAGNALSAAWTELDEALKA